MVDGNGSRALGEPVNSWHRIRRLIGSTRTAWADENAAQIVEFAVALPLLVLFVVGIFDFSAAYTLKQKLTNVARETARVSAADPSNDLANATPASISDAFWVMDNYLLANKINDCGIGPSSVTHSSPSTVWTFSAAGNGCVGTGLVVIVNRGYYFPSNSTQPAGLNCAAQSPGSQAAIIATCVSVQYAYQWRFGRVARLLGSAITLPTTLTATAVAMNEN
jgi:Flp pilus assembly protein TadG